MVLLLFLLWDKSFACSEIQVRKAHEWFFGVDFPYWFSYAQLKVESNCIWRTSLDGWGSVGYAQITPKFWDKELKEIAPDWKVKDSSDHYIAHAYILKKMQDCNPCKKLFVMYQCYNRSCNKVLREVGRKCSWEEGLQKCLEKPMNICVWKKDGKCIQYKTDCEINYNYSVKIYEKGVKMERWKTKRWIFW